MYDLCYLSPHFDDVSLSCGGRIWHETQQGKQVLVITICAGVPPAGHPMSELALRVQRGWPLVNVDLDRPDLAALRVTEDQNAIQILGADLIHWPILDCIYRQKPDGSPMYGTIDDIFSVVHPLELGLVPELAGWIASLPLKLGAKVIAPLTAGRHIDHQIVRAAAEASGRPLSYYEDFPYARQPGAVERVVPAGATAELTPISLAALHAKVASITAYTSQAGLFSQDPDILTAVQAYGELVGGKAGIAERYWKL